MLILKVQYTNTNYDCTKRAVLHPQLLCDGHILPIPLHADITNHLPEVAHTSQHLHINWAAPVLTEGTGPSHSSIPISHSPSNRARMPREAIRLPIKLQSCRLSSSLCLKLPFRQKNFDLVTFGV